MARRAKVASTPTIASLRLETRHLDDDIITVEDGEQSFRFDVALLTVDNGTTVIKPAELLATQAGRWVKRVVGGKAILAWGGNYGDGNSPGVWSHGGQAGFVGTSPQAKITVPFTGILKNLFVDIGNGAYGAGDGIEHRVFVNDASTGLLVVISGDSQVRGSDLVNTKTVVAGDQVEIRGATDSGTPGAKNTHVVCELTPN